MRKMFYITVFFMLFAWGRAFAQSDDAYRVGTGDVLFISIIGHDDLTTTEAVSPDGSITFPYINSIKVEGRTLKEIRDDLVKALSPNYIQFPDIIVRLQEPNSQKFYVYGEVRNPGVFRLDKNITVLKAICMAGGYSTFANKKLIKVLRPKVGVAGYDSVIVNIDDVVKNPSADNDTFIHNEDVIVVNEE